MKAQKKDEDESEQKKHKKITLDGIEFKYRKKRTCIDFRIMNLNTAIPTFLIMINKKMEIVHITQDAPNIGTANIRSSHNFIHQKYAQKNFNKFIKEMKPIQIRTAKGEKIITQYIDMNILMMEGKWIGNAKWLLLKESPHLFILSKTTIKRLCQSQEHEHK